MEAGTEKKYKEDNWKNEYNWEEGLNLENIGNLQKEIVLREEEKWTKKYQAASITKVKKLKKTVSKKLFRKRKNIIVRKRLEKRE